MNLSDKSNNYWTEFWNSNPIVENKDPQLQVGRSINGQPITNELWNLTLNFVRNQLELNSSDIILDIGAGSGMISIPYSKIVHKVVALDISSKLLDRINESNIKKIEADARYVNFEKDAFSKVILYFALQHFTQKETIQLFKNMYNWIKKGGIAYIGDIPDITKLFVFHSKPEWKDAFFKSLENDKPIIGTWFTQEFLVNLAMYCGFKHVEVVEQPDYLINSHYRFDLKLIK